MTDFGRDTSRAGLARSPISQGGRFAGSSKVLYPCTGDRTGTASCSSVDDFVAGNRSGWGILLNRSKQSDSGAPSTVMGQSQLRNGESGTWRFAGAMGQRHGEARLDGGDAGRLHRAPHRQRPTLWTHSSRRHGTALTRASDFHRNDVYAVILLVAHRRRVMPQQAERHLALIGNGGGVGTLPNLPPYSGAGISWRHAGLTRGIVGKNEAICAGYA